MSNVWILAQNEAPGITAEPVAADDTPETSTTAASDPNATGVRTRGKGALGSYESDFSWFDVRPDVHDSF